MDKIKKGITRLLIIVLYVEVLIDVVLVLRLILVGPENTTRYQIEPQNRVYASSSPVFEPTPTPFQPKIAEEPVVEIIAEEEITNPYDLEGIRFDTSEFIEIKFGELFSTSFNPTLETFEHYKPGTGRAGVYADHLGNITVNPHSGCYWLEGKHLPSAGEYLRSYIEGGDCYNVTEFDSSEVEVRVENILNSHVQIIQGDIAVPVSVLEVGVIPYDVVWKETITMDPSELVNRVGRSIPDQSRVIIIITSGWDISKYWLANGPPWFSAERLLIVMEMEKD